MTGEALSSFYHRSATRAFSLARRVMTGQPWVILDVAYRALLQRPPDPHARSWLPQLRSGELSVEQLGRKIMDSDEFRVLAASTSLGESLHRSRCDWVRSLPPARRIMDLGGTNLHHEHGALVTMGYPYPFDELLVVDLPPDERHQSYNKGGLRQDVDVGRGLVRYAYHSMADLDRYPDASFDMVFSGQSIEHVPAGNADVILKQARRILRPGGWLALDTPNRSITRRWVEQYSPSGAGYIDPDHKYEYTVGELVDKVTSAGFLVVERKGLNLAAALIERNAFSEEDLARHPGVYAEAEACYAVALLCRTPS